MLKLFLPLASFYFDKIQKCITLEISFNGKWPDKNIVSYVNPNVNCKDASSIFDKIC